MSLILSIFYIEVSVKYLIRDVGLKKWLGLRIDIWESLTEQQQFYEETEPPRQWSEIMKQKLIVKVSVIRRNEGASKYREDMDKSLLGSQGGWASVIAKEFLRIWVE